MGVKALFVLSSAILFSVVFGRAALAYYYDTHICFNPIGVVDDERRVRTAISSFKLQAGIKPGVLALEPEFCCRVAPERIASDYAITFTSVLMGRQAKFVEINDHSADGSPYFIRTDVCGNYVKG